MITNDMLRRLRYALNQTNSQVLELFRLGHVSVTEAELDGWLRREEEPGFVLCPPRTFAAYLDGLILQRRGPHDPSSPAPPRDVRVDNNLFLRKLRIALDYKEADMLEVLALGGMKISPSELGALFRSPTHKHYRACGDQLLRNFLVGLTAKLQG